MKIRKTEKEGPPFVKHIEWLTSKLRKLWSNFIADNIIKNIRKGKYDSAKEDTMRWRNEMLQNIKKANFKKDVNRILDDSTANWKQELGIRRTPTYQQMIDEKVARQWENFQSRRVTHAVAPEIIKQIELMQSNPNVTDLDLDFLEQRVDKWTSGQDYVEGFSAVHVARVWNYNGFRLAEASNITEMQVVGHVDDKICSVCLVFNGILVPVSSANNYYSKYLHEENYENYKENWKFPRFHEIQLMPISELETGKFTPPFHVHCRCTVRPI